jgi:hypothetical protein
MPWRDGGIEHRLPVKRGDKENAMNQASVGPV